MHKMQTYAFSTAAVAELCCTNPKGGVAGLTWSMRWLWIMEISTCTAAAAVAAAAAAAKQA
jgi:hypothetical protein